MAEVTLRYLDATNVDVFAPAIGNAHGTYKRAPVLDFQRVSDIVAAQSGVYTAPRTEVAPHRSAASAAGAAEAAFEAIGVRARLGMRTTSVR